MGTVRICKLGVITERLDKSDLKLGTFAAPDRILPGSVDLRPNFPVPPYDQGNIGSCVANAACALVQFVSGFKGSRLFLYYQARASEGRLADPQGGTTVHDCISMLEVLGVPPETDWPYDTTQQNAAPPQHTYVTALNHRVLVALNVPVELAQMKGCLDKGSPFMLGFQIFGSFWDPVTQGTFDDSGALFTPGTGVVRMPSLADQSAGALGGHAVLVMGYDDAQRWWIVRSSWGKQVGDRGYYYFPYDYLTEDRLASDIWAIRQVSAGPPTNCVQGDWAATEPCSKTACGTQGVQMGTRPVITPSSDGGQSCSYPKEPRVCVNAPCSTTVPTNCEVSPWSAYSTCDALTCGAQGLQSSTRTVITPAANGGAVCPELLQKQYCTAVACPAPIVPPVVTPLVTTLVPTVLTTTRVVDCQVGPWSDGGACSSTSCGIPGTKTSSRSVTVLPSGGGRSCPSLVQTQPCSGPCHALTAAFALVAFLTIMVMIVVAVLLS